MFIVVTDFIWNPFADVDLASATNLDALTGQLIHTMRLYNSKDSFIYNFRDSFLRGQAGTVPYFGGAGKQYSSYILSKENLQGDIFKFASPKLATWNVDIVPLTTNEPGSPLGYGGQRVVRSVFTPQGARVSSMGMYRDPGSVSSNVGNRNEFFDNLLDPPAGDNNKLTPPNTLQNDTVFGFPLVTFGVVEVNEIPDTNLR